MAEPIDVEQFLDSNAVMSGWKELILGNEKLKSALSDIIVNLELTSNKTYTLAPHVTHILRAFAHCNPDTVKVIIIGSSPITGNNHGQFKANGLAFSSDTTELSFRRNQAIPRVHQALRKAGVLKQDATYHCGHQKWAENGVLLLNAALTIPVDEDTPDSIKKHCDTWRPFLSGLLKNWNNNIQSNQVVCVMLWGSASKNKRKDYPNYAEKLWNDSEIKNPNFKIMKAHHPTFPRWNNDFVGPTDDPYKKVKAHFRTVCDTFPYQTIFDTDESDDIEDWTAAMANLSLQPSS